MSANDLEALRRFDTPTICNALELVVPDRRAVGFTTRPLVCAVPNLPPIVGHARTATIRAIDTSDLSAEEARAIRAAYYEYIAAEPRPTITVIQDLDPEPGFGAFWGEVNTAIHMGLGCLGVVTDGSIRDLDDLAPGFQLLAGSVGPSHAHVHVVEMGVPVTIHGMDVADGDILHADRHGAVVIPPHAVTKLPAAVDLITRREKVVLDAARGEDFDIDALKAAMENSVDIH
jgi:regulator of RNase E activity RraA